MKILFDILYHSHAHAKQRTGMLDRWLFKTKKMLFFSHTRHTHMCVYVGHGIGTIWCSGMVQHSMTLMLLISCRYKYFNLNFYCKIFFIIIFFFYYILILYHTNFLFDRLLNAAIYRQHITQVLLFFLL